MKRVLAFVALTLFSATAHAHEDRILTIKSTGEVTGLPESYGSVRVLASYDKAGDVVDFVIKSPRFNVRLNQCVLRHLRDVSAIKASGSWYHDLDTLPAYISIDFVQTAPSTNDHVGTGVDIAFSLEDGKILMAQRRERTLFGRPGGKVMQHAASCKDWL